MEMPGLPTVENIEDLYHIPPKAKLKPRVKFSSDPIKVGQHQRCIHYVYL